MDMVFRFADKESTMKHLGHILAVKRPTFSTLQLKLVGNGEHSTTEEILHYESEAYVQKDLNNLHKDLNDYVRLINDIKKTTPVGFAVSDEEIEEDEEEE